MLNQGHCILFYCIFFVTKLNWSYTKNTYPYYLFSVYVLPLHHSCTDVFSYAIFDVNSQLSVTFAPYSYGDLSLPTWVLKQCKAQCRCCHNMLYFLFTLFIICSIQVVTQGIVELASKLQCFTTVLSSQTGICQRRAIR